MESILSKTVFSEAHLESSIVVSLFFGSASNTGVSLEQLLILCSDFKEDKHTPKNWRFSRPNGAYFEVRP